MTTPTAQSGPSASPRSRIQSPVPSKPHIWRDDALQIFFGTPSHPWRCANLAHSVVKFGGRGATPSDAYNDWRATNSGTGRYG